jgi:glycosyltransferase involved in cell wall biosynthesis
VVADLHRGHAFFAGARVSGRLTIVRSGLPLPPPDPGELVVSFDQFRGWIRRGAVLAHLGRHGEGRLLVHRLETAGRPLRLGLALRAMSRGRVFVEDARGRQRALTSGLLARWVGQLASEPFRIPALVAGVERVVSDLERGPRLPPSVLNLSASPLYLRTDLSFGVRAGGSVGHIAGVVNELEAFTGRPILLTTDEIPTLAAGIEVHQVAPSEAFWNFKELPTFGLNDVFLDAAEQALKGRQPAFVYQRYSLNSYAGIRIARRHGVPLVLEYNGSEIWMSRHWGRPLRYERVSERIERLNLASADLIVVVSRAMADEVAGRGADRSRVLVNPNGADPNRYRADLDGAAVRARCGLGHAVVVGFIGTFGPWHGAEVLARAFVALRASDPSLAQRVRLLMIGDGATLASVKRILSEGGALEAAAFTGLVPQEDGPEFLAACDVLVSPHVPNADGTPFFGSPTKLFEYMAMGKGIVASDLDQIGEVLEHGRTAWLVSPGDVDALAAGLRRLMADRVLRDTLGAEARRQVLAQYTWRQHTKRTLDRLQEVVAAPAPRHSG